MAHEVTLITGDGVGPELAAAARRCVDATGVKINWDVQEAGVDVMARCGTPLPEATMESVRRTRCALKAPITTPVGTGFRSLNVHLRQTLGLFACLRPCKHYPGVRTFFSDRPVDLVIVRENTEDLYAGIEFEAGQPATGELYRLSQQDFAAAADQLGPRRDRHLDQADQRLGHRADRALRLRVRPRQRPQEGHGRPQGEHHEAQRRPVSGHRAEGRPGVSRTSSSRTASSTTCACSWCRSRSCTTCWCCRTSTATSSATWRPGLVGGLGVAPGANIGPDGAVFEATHGSAPKYKGQNKVNPTALILSGMLMLAPSEGDRRGRPAGKGRRGGDRRGQGRDLRHEARPRRSHRRRHPRNGRGDLPEAVDSHVRIAFLSL